ncbi:unnamed protein product [Didymodactylos carnosus]|uniref:Uncharacterized protein n=1 Tax=Didymodactylos carnosus TaxID=1234261 RepID=A0A815KPA2_9BILA|nr:unnamed protein product [Didymodactylos carnosus]CAF4287912.1 unnamed protein product [Didymodactylos carnosus]
MQTNTDEFKAEIGEQFPTEVIFNGKNLVDHHTRDHQQYGRDLLKTICFRTKYKISAQKWDEFFQKCMHRTLTQCLCDIRKKLKAQQLQLATGGQ